ncbi:MAG: hypothetical protein MPL62_18305 [Alphaproteobacteria bacterium]|nr:hypothetical protein [Alphaproteobacteria bacterium]
MNTNFPKFEMISGSIILLIIVSAAVAAFIVATLEGYLQTVLVWSSGLAPSLFLLYSENKKEKREHRAWLMRNEKAYVFALADYFFFIEARVRDKSIHLGKVRSELARKLEDVRAAMGIWGNASILRKWKSLQKNRHKLSAEERNARAEEFLLALRKEVGHDDSSLKEGELLSLLSDDEGKAK